MLETMPSLDQAKAALEAVRSVSSDVPVAVSLTFNEEGNTLYGDTPEDAVRELEALGVAVVGANCSQGPQAMLETVQRMAAVGAPAKLAAMPNAGSPAYVDGRYVYLCTPEYMASWARRFLQAGASAVGGCCGTTPAHIRNLVRSVRMFQPGRDVEAKVVTPKPAQGGARAGRARDEARARAHAAPQVRGLGRARPAARRRRRARSSSRRSTARRTRSTRSTSPTARAPRRA